MCSGLCVCSRLCVVCIVLCLLKFELRNSVSSLVLDKVVGSWVISFLWGCFCLG